MLVCWSGSPPRHVYQCTEPPDVCRTTFTIMTRGTEQAAWAARIHLNNTRLMVLHGVRVYGCQAIANRLGPGGFELHRIGLNCLEV